MNKPSRAKKEPMAELEVLRQKVKELTETNAKLRNNEKTFKTLLENLPQRIFLKDKNSVYIFWNNNYARDLRIKPGEIAGKTDYDFYPVHMAEKYIKDDRRAMLSGKTEEMEEKYIQDGKEITVQTVKTPVKDEEGNIIGVLGIFWDITERKRINAELVEYRDHLEALAVKRTAELKTTNELLQREITERKKVQERLLEQNNYTALVTEIWKIAADKSLTEPDIITRLLDKIGPAMNVSGALYLTLDPEKKEFITQLQWHKPKFQSKLVFAIPYDMTQYFFDKRPVEIPKDQISDKKHPFSEKLKKQNIKSCLIVPYGSQSKPEGLFVLIDCEKERQWTKLEKGILSEVVDIVLTRTNQITAEQALKESEDEYKTLSESSLTGIYIHQNGCYVFVNEKFAEIHGYTSQELLGKEYVTLIHPDERERVKQIALKRLKGEPTLNNYEVKRIKKDGTAFWCEVMAVRIGYKGKPAIMGNILDINDRKIAEKNLEKEQKKFRLLIEKLPLGIALIKSGGRYEYINQKFVELFGYTLKDISTGKEWFRKAYPDEDYRKQVISMWLKDLEMLKRGKFHSRTLKVTCKDGSRKTIQFMPMLMETGEPFVIYQDMTERIWAEEEIKKLTTAVEQSIDGVAIADLNGRLTYANEAFAIVHGYPNKEEIMGMEILDLHTKEQIDGYETLINHLRMHGSWIGEIENTRKNGTVFPAYVSITLLKDNKGTSTAILFSLRDITEQKMLEVQLHQAQKMEALGTIAGGIAHNFNNLLMGIMGNTSLMLLNTDPTHPYYGRLKTIEKQVQSGSRLTSQLLGYAREGKYEVKPINLNKLVIETSNTFGITKKEIRIHKDLVDNLFGIKADQGQVEQVLLNLYVNAADAMPVGGDLFLKTSNVTHKDMCDKPYKVKPGNYVLLTVRDTGIGMDKKIMEKIFDPFFTTKGLSKGTGLGLASVYGIIKSHGGYIDVDSQKGKGATFIIYFPASEKETGEEKEPSVMLYAGKETLLLVDDEDMILEVGAHMLKILGYDVLVAKGGKEGIKKYRSKKDKIDLVILDIIMPDMGGGEVYDRIKSINPDVKVLLSSGYNIEMQAKEILQRGCDGFIQKPFDLKGLSQKIREILDVN
ncbi:MAG TPA: PAS domain S-box protein [Desulfatiglandales bacterium]|nr:PAS domain S-box protein [Desulfatiglandales bacterium]